MEELEELRHLILGDKTEAIDKLEQHVTDPIVRARDVASVLPEAVAMSARGTERLSKALQAPVNDCIRLSVQRNPRMFADALFPAMGPAIRRAISESLKSFVQSLNSTIEHSVSARSLKWRWQAWRTGVPFGEIVLKQTLLYRVEEAYLIHRESGLLLDHVRVGQGVSDCDEDAVSAMLTAIQEFVKDAFTGPGEDNLETVDMGERVLWVMRGPHAILAVVVRGIPPLSLRARLAEVLDEIHVSYGGELSGFDGDGEKLPVDLSQLMEQCLTQEVREDERRTGGSGKWWWLVFLALVIGAVGYLLWQRVEGAREAEALRAAEARRVEQLRQVLQAAPGIVVVDARREGERIAVIGLRDPLARDAAAVALEQDFSAGEVAWSLSPYQSLEPAMVVARARRHLRAPPGIEMTLRGSSLVLSGAAPESWLTRVKSSLVMPAGIEAIDVDGVNADYSERETRLRELLEPPQGVSVEIDGPRIVLRGTAPWAWARQVPSRLIRLPWVSAYEPAALEVAEWKEARDIARQLEGMQILFTEGLSLAAGSRDELERLSRGLGRLAELDHRVGLDLKVKLVGHADSVGAESWNRWLRLQRATRVRSALTERGVTAYVTVTENSTPGTDDNLPDLTQRLVVVRIGMREPMAPTGGYSGS